MHRDREMRWLDDTVVAILTLGAQRPFLVQRAQHPRPFDRARPLPRGRRPHGVRRSLPGRLAARRTEDARTRCAAAISAQWRYTTKRGRPDTQPGYYEPREFSRKVEPMSIQVELGELRDGRRGAGAVRVPAHRLRRRERARGRDHADIGDGAITCEAGKRSCANAQPRPNVSLLWPPARARRLLADRRRSRARRRLDDDDHARTRGAAPPRARRRFRLRAGRRSSTRLSGRGRRSSAACRAARCRGTRSRPCARRTRPRPGSRRRRGP